jgi:hypothetical protein
MTKVGTADVMLLVGLAGLAMAVGRVNLAAGVMVGSVLAIIWLRCIRQSGDVGRRGVSSRIVIFLKSIIVSSVIVIVPIMVAIAIGAFFFASSQAHYRIDFDFKTILGIGVGALSSMPVTTFLVKRLW